MSRSQNFGVFTTSHKKQEINLPAHLCEGHGKDVWTEQAKI